MKGLGTLLLCLGAGAAGGYVIGRALGKTEEEKKKYGELGLFLGGGIGITGGALVNHLTQERHDTLNYSLHNRKKRVYDGICKEHRFEARMREHERDGKRFDKVLSDYPKPESTARNLERTRIRRNKAKYNIQHNCL